MPAEQRGQGCGSGLWMCCEGSRIHCSQRQQKSLITAVRCQDQVGSWIGHWRSSKTSGHQRLFKFGFSFLKTGRKDVCVLGWEVKGIQGNTLPFYSQMMADTQVLLLLKLSITKSTAMVLAGSLFSQDPQVFWLSYLGWAMQRENP